MDKLLQDTAREHKVDAKLLEQLVEIERPKVHLSKRRGVKAELRRAIEEHMEGRKS